MIESKAKTKTCCGPLAAMYALMTQTMYEGKVDHEDIKTFKCIGSECMAWRWDKGTMVGSLKTPRSAGCPEPSGNCGLAGRPS